MKSIFPPRPKGAIPPLELERYEKAGNWAVQYKYNGVRNCINISPERQVSICRRQGNAHLNYTLPSSVRDEILALPGLAPGKEYWLDSELLTKTTSPLTKEKIVLYDVLHADKYLFMKNQMKRLEILKDICGNPQNLDVCGIGLQISENLLMAPTFFDNFQTHFEEKSSLDEIEGLVLRKRDATLDNFGQKEYEVSWLIRCRKPHKNYNF